MSYIEECGEINEEIFKQLKTRKMEREVSRKEQLAMKMYDDYSEAVGGKAFNGDPLPKSEEFFSDPNKQKQSNAWIVAAQTAYEFMIII